MSGKYLKRRRDKRVCARKVTYHSEQAAHDAARRVRKTTGYARVYKCHGLKGRPHHWHLTTRRRNRP